MANTVNDVMNVIASPDYGIKNIAGTNQEILAILSGTQNSKNNIHAIVDDIKNLLQTLVNASTEKKPIEIDNKSTKINRKHIQDILDETKGIRKAIDNLTKAFEKQNGKTNFPTIAKLTDKASQKVADAMISNIDKQNKGGGISALVDAFTKLKNISLKDIIISNQKVKLISKIFKNAKKDLNIDEKDLNRVIKLINAAPEMMSALLKSSWKSTIIVKNNVVEKLNDILIGKKSILSISKILQKNEKIFDNANKAVKSIKELTISFNKAMKKIVFAGLWAKLSNVAITNIDTMLDNLIAISKKLAKNKKNIDVGKKAAKDITVFTGNLMITSIFLTASIVTSAAGILGALLLGVLVNTLVPIAKTLSKNDKNIKKAVKTAFIFTAFTGIMLVTSLILTKIAENGKNTLLGALVMAGVVAVNIFTFKILSKATKNILLGAVALAIMSGSLILFGIALNKITQSTKDVSWKQFGMIAAFMGTFALATALIGVPVIAGLIAIGSIALSVMSVSLIFFASSLGEISKSTKNLDIQKIKDVAKSMRILSRNVALMAFMLPAVGIGAITLGIMNGVLHTFVKSLKIIDDMGGVPTKLVSEVIDAMKLVGNFFKKNTLSLKAIRNARLYKKTLRPFASAARHLAKLNKTGSVPISLVYDTLDAMKVIANYYADNPISKRTIKQAKRYKKMLRPFGKTIGYLAKLKELGEIPISLVYGTLDIMKVIANYYADNPISKKTIKEAKRYKKMLRPFGKTIGYLAKLKELGEIPLGLVYQTLDVMTIITNYYKDNPIKRSTIKNAKKYKKLMRPFGKTIGHLAKLKELGEIPLGLVYQTLDVMTIIANYYKDNPIKRSAIKNAKKYKKLMRPFGKTIGHLTKLKELGEIPLNLVSQTLDAISMIAKFYQNQKSGSWKERREAKKSAEMITKVVSSFGVAVNALKDLGDLKSIPSDSIQDIVDAISSIAWYYDTVHFGNNIELKSKLTELIVNKFTIMAKNIQDKFDGIKYIDYTSIISIVATCRSILNFYKYTKFSIKKEKVLRMNKCVEVFFDVAEQLKERTQGFSIKEYKSVKLAVKSMTTILKFLKKNTLNAIQRKRAKANLLILKSMASVMSSVSNINSMNISSIGDALSTTLGEVKTIDISQVQAVTDMFNAFSGINKSENIINKFTESVKEFTEACKGLMEAMCYNTDAINGMDTSSNSGGSIFSDLRQNINDYIGIESSNTESNSNGIRIANVEEIANSIATKINGSLSLDIPDTQVQLLINGSGGNEWTISRY